MEQGTTARSPADPGSCRSSRSPSALGLEVGDALVASIDDGRLVLAPREAARARLLERFPAAAEAPSAVDELLAARRAEARREAADAAGSDEPT